MEKHLKRYTNRKLYDLTEARYKNLPFLMEEIAKGARIKVTDHKTGRDLTGYVLASMLTQELMEKPVADPELVARLHAEVSQIVKARAVVA